MNKTVIITGASRGIGKAAAIKFASEGYNIVLNSKNGGETLYNTLSLCRTALSSYIDNKTPKTTGSSQYGKEPHIISVPGDVSDPSFAPKLIEAASHEFGRIDILINNAGISFIGLIQNTSDEIWQNIINTNLSSVHYCTRAVIPYMLKNMSEHDCPSGVTENGRIINISSVWGNTGASCEAAYSASKGGLNAYTKACAKELAPSGISVNAISCGFVDTDMNKNFTEEERLGVIEQIPASRAALPEEIAEIIYLTAQMPTYLTGQIITADGGWI